MARQPAIVAELGRPETPEETAARKAETSRKHRANQTLLNLVGATIASLAIVLFLVVVVVRPAPAPVDPIDYATIASQAGEDLVVPALPSGWVANAARFEGSIDVPTWYIGFITPGEQFIAFNEGLDANATWQAATLDGATATGDVRIDGTTWTTYDRRDAKEPGNHAYAMSATFDTTTIVLHGTAATEEFELLAATVTAELETP